MRTANLYVLLISVICLTSCLSGPIVEISDPNFKLFLVENHEINTNKDSEIQVTEADAFTGTINCSKHNISSLKGIEAFVNLTELICSENEISELDVSENGALQRLICSKNKMKRLRLFYLHELRELTCNDNELTEINLVSCPALQDLYLSKNKLTKLDLEGTYGLLKLHCDSNKIERLNLLKDSQLNVIYCQGNKLKELDFSNTPQLSKLNCSGNDLTYLNIKKRYYRHGVYFMQFNTLNNPNLKCIAVDSVELVLRYWDKDKKDQGVEFSKDCGTADVQK